MKRINNGDYLDFLAAKSQTKQRRWADLLYRQPQAASKPQLMKKNNAPWWETLETTVRTYHAILHAFEDHSLVHNGQYHPGEMWGKNPYPDQAAVLDMNAPMIKNFGRRSFEDLVVAMIGAGTDPLNIARSRLWQTAPETWCERARQGAEQIKPGSAKELV